MAVLQASISLRIYGRKGAIVSREKIKSALNLEELEKLAKITYGKFAYQATLIEFLKLDLSDFSSDYEPSESFFNEISKAQQNLVDWLNKQSLEAIEKLREESEIDVFIGLWIDDDQMEWRFSSALISVCGKLGLPIQMISND